MNETGLKCRRDVQVCSRFVRHTHGLDQTIGEGPENLEINKNMV